MSVFKLLLSAPREEARGRWFQKGEVSRPPRVKGEFCALAYASTLTTVPASRASVSPGAEGRLSLLSLGPLESQRSRGVALACAPSSRRRTPAEAPPRAVGHRGGKPQYPEGIGGGAGRGQPRKGAFPGATCVGGTSGCFPAVAISRRRSPWGGGDLLRAGPAPHLGPFVGNEPGGRKELTFAFVGAVTPWSGCAPRPPAEPRPLRPPSSPQSPRAAPRGVCLFLGGRCGRPAAVRRGRRGAQSRGVASGLRGARRCQPCSPAGPRDGGAADRPGPGQWTLVWDCCFSAREHTGPAGPAAPTSAGRVSAVVCVGVRPGAPPGRPPVPQGVWSLTSTRCGKNQ